MSPDIRHPLPKSEKIDLSGQERLDSGLYSTLQTTSVSNAKELFCGIISHSPYMTSLIHKHPHIAERFLTDPTDKILDDIFNTIPKAADKNTSRAEVMSHLRLTKQKTALLVGLADLANHWDLEHVTRALSNLADLSVQYALAFLLQDYKAKGLITNDTPNDCGYTVIAMGKWGGIELNYSSDIDFITLYDPDLFPSPPDTTQTVANRLTRDLVDLIDTRTKDGYVFRTDLRLRPDPASTPLAVSVVSAEKYYHKLGQNWERAALIKARACAGDQKTATRFMTLLDHWIWRENMDFETIQDIHSIKRQINSTQKHTSDQQEILGRNIKLGHGGIREVEFFVQTQQLIYGGKSKKLRSFQTIPALHTLAVAGYIQNQTATEMENAYRYFRKIEHRLQMINDRQTHDLPPTEEALEKFAHFTGAKNTAELSTTLQHHLTQVRTHYAALFEDAPSLSSLGNLVFTGTDDDPETLNTLTKMGFGDTSRIAGLIRGWHHGRYPAMQSPRARQILTELTPTLLKTFGKTAFPDEAFFNFDKFFSSLDDGVPVLSMFYQNTDMLALVAQIFGTSQTISKHFREHPALFEELLTQNIFTPLPHKDILTAELQERRDITPNNTDAQINTIKKWVRDKKFQAGIHIIKHITPPENCGTFLSDIADISIQAIYDIVKSDFEQEHGKMNGGQYALIAFGRLGSQKMSIASDLDLVAVYKSPTQNTHDTLSPAQYYTRLTQRLLSTITSMTATGRLYEVDMRLRPNGDAGPIATPWAGFVEYYQKDAWAFELMSLIRARPFIGDHNLCEDLKNNITETLTQRRNTEKLRHDINDMRQKVAHEFSPQNVWSMKYRHGGLMDIMFITQFLILAHAHDHPDIIKSDIASGLNQLLSHKLIKKEVANDMLNMLHLAKRVQTFLRLCTTEAFDPDQASNAFKRALVEITFDHHTDMSFDDLQNIITQKADSVTKHYRHIFQTE